MQNASQKIIRVRIHPKTSQQKVAVVGSIHEVWVTAAAEKNKANEELIEVLANYFGVAKSCVEIKSGLTSRNKVVSIQIF